MRATCRALSCLLLLLSAAFADDAPDKPKGPPPIGEVTKGMERREGLFDLFVDAPKAQLLMVVKAEQLKQDVLVVTTLARGHVGGMVAGVILDQNVIAFRRVGPVIQVLLRDVSHRAAPGSAAAGAVTNAYADSVLQVLPVVAEEGGAALVDIGSLLQGGTFLPGLRIDPARSTVESAKSFPANLALRVSMELVDSSPADTHRAEFMFNVLALPPAGSFEPRVADDRVGYFTAILHDYTSQTDDSSKVRLITRWRLARSDPQAAVSDAKDPIIWWIEKTVPEQYRGAIREGILEWNKAFEKAGIKNAIEVRQQTPEDDIDPADVRYNTFRWGTSDSGYAIGPSAIDPRTGQILGAEVVFDDSMVRWERLYVEAQTDSPAAPEALSARWLRERWHLLALPGSAVPPAPAMLRPPRAGWRRECRLQAPITGAYLRLAGVFEQLRRGAEPGGGVPPELLNQMIRELAMHEVGHCLGLRHNFIASTMLPNDRLADKELTGKQGLVGSVMDYSPPSIAVPGQPQGFYYTPTIGPYDYHAIEYGYAGFKDDDTRLALAGQGGQPGLAYATDEDAYDRAQDPRTDIFDLGEPLDWAQHRLALLHAGLPKVVDRVVAVGGEWRRARQAFLMLYGAAYETAWRSTAYIGGWLVERDHRGDPGDRQPVKPVPFDRQRAALKLITDALFRDSLAAVDPDLMRRLGPQQKDDDDYDRRVEIDPVAIVLSARNVAMSELLSSQRLNWLQNQQAYAVKGEEPLTVAEVLETLSRATFPELPLPGAAPRAEPPGRLARATQRLLVSRLAAIVIGDASAPADARALARRHLSGLGQALKGDGRPAGEALVAAHYDELSVAIDRALNANVLLRGL